MRTCGHGHASIPHNMNKNPYRLDTGFALEGDFTHTAMPLCVFKLQAACLLRIITHQQLPCGACNACGSSMHGRRSSSSTTFSAPGFCSVPDTNRPPAVGERPACAEERRSTALVPAAMKRFIVHDSLPRIAGQLAPVAHEMLNQTLCLTRGAHEEQRFV